MGKHAILSPSGARRWMACTPSARLESEFPDSTSIFAEEGTLAHAVGELIIRFETGTITIEQFNTKLDELKEVTFSGDKEEKLYSESLYDYANDYAQFILEQCVGDYNLLIEVKLDMTSYIEEGFGTADALVLTPKKLIFNDLKFGKGVRVDATNNKQLMIYALGALNDYGYLYDTIEEVEMNIYQPRIDNVSSFTISVVDLIHWAETELKEKAKLAFAGEGDFNPGNHCGFCRAKAQCKALAEYNLELAKEGFKNPDLLTEDEIVKILDQQKLFDTWISAVTEYAFKEALNGKTWPGYKLVEGRSNRKVTDTLGLAAVLTEKGYEGIYKPQALLALGELEKMQGKKLFTELSKPYLTKPEGKPTLVPASDKREAYKKADSFFTDVPEEDI